MNYEPASDEPRMQNNCYNMMHFFSKRIVMALWACCSISASYALKFTVDKITYETLTDNTVKVSGFDFYLIDVTIPSTVEYQNVVYQVKQIGDKGLYGNKSSKYSKMETLVISEGIEIIGNNAIQSNKYLKSVFLPKSLKKIGDSAFSSLKSLAEVHFPNGSTLQTISKEAFNSCKQLEIINFYPTGIAPAKLIPTFPESLETIGSKAFNSVPSFKNLILHGGLSQISEYSFANCPNLEYIWLQEGISSIGQYAFYDCHALKCIILPSTITNVSMGGLSCAWKNGKPTRTTNRTYFLLGDTPFKYSSRAQTDFYGLWLPANIGSITGDHFYVKELALNKYMEVWGKNFEKYFDYKIPFNSELSYSTNCREFDTDYHVTAINGNYPFVATDFAKERVTFTSLDNGIVPAETPVLIRKKSDENTWYQIAERQGAQLNMENYLKGVTYADEISPKTDDGYVNFVLNNGEFCRFDNAGVLSDHKAYLQLPESVTSRYTIEFKKNVIDGIENAITDEMDASIYSLSGVRVNCPTKGVYIKKGKKILIK